MGIENRSDLFYGLCDNRRTRPHVGARGSNVTSANMNTNCQDLVPARRLVGIVFASKLWNCRIERASEIIDSDTKQREEIVEVVEKVDDVTIVAVGRNLSHTKIEVRFPGIDPFSHRPISMPDLIEWGVDIGKSTDASKIDRPHYIDRLERGTFERNIKDACNFTYPKSESQALLKEDLLTGKGWFATYQYSYAVFR